MLVTIDKFTNWIEARPISMIKSEQAVLFFLDIVHRCGYPNSIILEIQRGQRGRRKGGVKGPKWLEGVNSL